MWNVIYSPAMTTETIPPTHSQRLSERWIYLGITLVVGILYGPTVGYDFVNYDDYGLIFDSPFLPPD